MLRWLVLAVAAARGTAHVVGPLRPRCASVTACRVLRPPACAADEPVELLLFDPRSDELPFPFGAPSASYGTEEEETLPPMTYRYAFDRSIYLRMLRDACDEDGSVRADTLIGQCCKGGEGEAVGALALGSESLVRVGTVGSALRLVDVQFVPRDGPGASTGFDSEFGSEVAMVAVHSAFVRRTHAPHKRAPHTRAPHTRAPHTRAWP